MIKVEGQKIELGCSDGVLLKELACLVCVLKLRMVSRGVYGAEQAEDAVANAVGNSSAYHLDDLRSDARMAYEAEQMALQEGAGRYV